MKVTFRGGKAVIEKENFYCKAGAYDHKSRSGWVLKVDGEIVLGNKLVANNTCLGAARSDFPEYRTRKSLLQDIEYFNELYERRKIK